MNANQLICYTKTALIIIAFCSILGSVYASNSDLTTEAEYRAGAIQTIVDIWKHTEKATDHPRWHQGITTLLQRLGADDLEAALNAASYDDLTEILQHSTPVSDMAVDFDEPQVAGQLYYPLSPCRLVDTRIAIGEYAGPVGRGSTANYHAKNIDEILKQGGLSGGCSIPAIASALVLSIASTAQAGPGHLRAFPHGHILPMASIVNFSGTNIANATILPLCINACSYDFSIYASQSSHVVVDVMGFFAD